MLTVQAFAGASRAAMVFDDDIACTVRKFIAADIAFAAFFAKSKGDFRNDLDLGNG